MAHVTHELYRTAHVCRDGLTDKEFRYLMNRHAAVQEEMQKVTALVERLRHNGRK